MSSPSNTKLSLRGFSLTEFMVALGIAAFLGVLVAILFFVGREERQLSEQRARLNSQHQELELRLQKILDDAVKNTSSTLEDGLAGIQRLDLNGECPEPGPGNNCLGRPDPDDPFDGISLILERYPDFSVPVTVPNPTDVGEQNQVIMDSSVFGGDPDQLAYFFEGSQSADYLILTNIETTGIFQNQPALANGNILQIVEPTNDTDYFLEYAGLTSSMSFGERMDIDLAENSLILRSAPSATVPRPQVTLAENVVEFEVRYRFAKSTPSGDVIVEGVSAPDPAGVVDWSDLSQVRIQIAYESDMEWPGELMSNVGTSYFPTDNGMLGYRASISIAPAKFKRGLGEIGFQGSALCSTSNPLNRCRPECEGEFEDDSQNSPGWEVYGQHVESGSPSAYCACGSLLNAEGDFEEFVPPSQGNHWNEGGLPRWEDANAQERNRLNACLAHYVESEGGCSSVPRWLRRDHPLAMMACHCVKSFDYLLGDPDGDGPLDGPINYVPDPDDPDSGSFTISGGNISDLEGQFADGSVASNSQFECQNWQVSYPERQSCDYAASSLWGGSNTPWEDECICKDFEIADGEAKPITPWAKDWKSICSIGDEDDRRATCSNLYDPDPNGDGNPDDAKYKYYNSSTGDNPDGMLAQGEATDPYKFHAAVVCECLREIGNPDFQEVVSQNFQGGFNRGWEFRSTAGADILPGYPPADIHGSKGSISVSITIDDGTSVGTYNNMVCNQAYTMLQPNVKMLSQCTHPSSEQAWRYERVGETDPPWPWRHYCNTKCTLSNNMCGVKQLLTGGNFGDSCAGFDPCVTGGPPGGGGTPDVAGGN